MGFWALTIVVTHSSISFAIFSHQNSEELLREFLLHGEWFVPEYLIFEINLFTAYVSFGYIVILSLLFVSILRLRKFQGPDSRAKLNVKIVIVHMVTMLLSVSAVLMYLYFAIKFLKPNPCIEKAKER